MGVCHKNRSQNSLGLLSCQCADWNHNQIWGWLINRRDGDESMMCWLGEGHFWESFLIYECLYNDCSIGNSDTDAIRRITYLSYVN